MAQLVQVALARDVTEAEEIRTILREVGIDAELESAVDPHPSAVSDGPQKVLVPESSLDTAQSAIEAMTEPDELIADA